jgi:ribosomal protein S27AE
MMAKRTRTPSNWDSAKIRKQREYGWFRQHEPELIDRARQARSRLEESERQRLQTEAEALLEGPAGKCPKCGADLVFGRIEGAPVRKCPACNGVFLEANKLELLLLAHDEGRRWFFRRYPGSPEH